MFSEEQYISTYLSMARTDPSQIGSILDEKFEELNSMNFSSASEHTIFDAFEPYFRLCKILLFGQINFEAAV